MSTETTHAIAGLSPAEQTMLNALAQHKGTPVTRDQLALLTGRPAPEANDRAIDVCVCRLRKSLEGSGLKVASVYRIGYVLQDVGGAAHAA